MILSSQNQRKKSEKTLFYLLTLMSFTNGKLHFSLGVSHHRNMVEIANLSKNPGKTHDGYTQLHLYIIRRSASYPRGPNFRIIPHLSNFVNRKIIQKYSKNLPEIYTVCLLTFSLRHGIIVG